MLRILGRVAGAAADSVIHHFIAHREERGRRDAKHGVIQDRPLRGVTIAHRKRSTLKRHFRRWMRFRIVHVHVPRLGRGVDLLVKLVRPGSDDLLEIVVAELAVVKGVVAEIDRVLLIRRRPLDHDRSGRLIAGIVLPKRHVSAVGETGLNGPLVVDPGGRENAGLRVVIESVEQRMARHEIVRRQLRFDVRFGNDATDPDVHPLKNRREVEVEIDHRHIEAVIGVVLEQLVAKQARAKS